MTWAESIENSLQRMTWNTEIGVTTPIAIFNYENDRNTNEKYICGAFGYINIDRLVARYFRRRIETHLHSSMAHNMQ